MVHVLLKMNSNFCILFVLHALKGLVDSLANADESCHDRKLG